MMTVSILGALALLMALPTTQAATQAAAPAQPAAQAPSIAPAPPSQPVLPPIMTPPADVTMLEGSTFSADCGGQAGLQGRAFCVSTLLTQTGALAEAYIADLEAKGWLVAAGDANRVVFVRRKSDGACDGLQMQAFYDMAVATTPTTLGYLGFGVVPGNVCATPSPAAATAPGAGTTPQ